MNSLIETILLFTIAAGSLSIVYGFFTGMNILNSSAGNAKMQEIASAIQIGAKAYLARQYKTIAVVGVVVLVIIFFVFSPLVGLGYFIGATLSGIAGYVGMLVSVQANVRTAEASRKGLASGLAVAFKSGAVTGMLVAGLALLAIAVYYYFLLKAGIDDREVVNALVALGFGASLISIFARLGGGIFTKGADVGADLVGKVEAGIPEDDPRNPATIADNVGDNVGDVAGMGADLFGSYVATVLAAMVLGNYVIKDNGGFIDDAFGGIGAILLPMSIAGIGIVISILGTLLVKIKSNDAKEAQVQTALNIGNWVSIALVAVSCFFLVNWMLPAKMNMNFYGEGLQSISSMRVFYAALVGLVVGAVISSVTEYYTGLGKKPILKIVEKSSTGAGTNIIAGLATGMISTFPTVILFAAAIWTSYSFAGFYGVALAASAMMATTAMQLAIDAFGPIADNAGGIAEMSELPAEVREKTDILDAVGNTTAASGKGFAIASAALTSLALFAAFVGVAMPDNQHIDIYKADVLAALFVGGMIPFIFSSLAIRAVGEAAMAMVEEVRRQFRTIPGIMEGTGKPEYDKCVAISTEASLKKMMLPGAITIISPILIGFTMGPEALGGFLAGATVSGVLMGIFQNNAGGAWDNAKKSFEKGVEINGEMFYKKSEPHKASVTGDTVGDPFKDTSGPSMNILIKLMSIVSLVIAPTLAQLHPTKSIEVKSQTMEISVINTDSSMTDSATTVTISADTKTLVQALQEDGLAPTDNVNIQVKNGKISVNGTALSEEQNEKYAAYLKKK